MAKRSALVDTRVIYCGDNLDQLRKLPDNCVAPISRPMHLDTLVLLAYNPFYTIALGTIQCMALLTRKGEPA